MAVIARNKSNTVPVWLKNLSDSVKAIFADALNPVFTAPSNPLFPSWLNKDGEEISFDAETLNPTEYLYTPEQGDARTLVGFEVQGTNANQETGRFVVPGTVGAAIAKGESTCFVGTTVKGTSTRLTYHTDENQNVVFGLSADEAKEFFGIG